MITQFHASIVITNMEGCNDANTLVCFCVLLALFS